MDFDPDGRRLPIKVDSTSNGEYLPQPLGHAQRAANALAHERVAAAAQRLGQGRRQFLTSLGGAAATLLAFNEAHAALGATGSRYALSADAPFEPELATAELAKREFIFDVQTHCVDPAARWAKGRDGKLWQRNLFEVFGQGSVCDEGYECYSARRLLKDVYLDSDTDVAVVSALWGSQGSNPTPIDYAAEARAIIDEAQGRERCLLHGGVMPNEAGELERMQEMVDVHGVSAWKLYPQWGPDGVGFHMDDPVGITFLERARELGVKIVAAHRGLPLPGLQYEYSDPADIARVAARYPDMTFLCYHSGFEPGVTEGPYDPDNPRPSGGRFHAQPGKSLRRARRGLARAHVEAGCRRARHRQAPQVLRRGAHLLGHRRHLVRKSAGSDPGLPEPPDLGCLPRALQLPGAFRPCPRAHPRAERRRGVRAGRRRAHAPAPCRPHRSHP